MTGSAGLPEALTVWGDPPPDPPASRRPSAAFPKARKGSVFGVEDLRKLPKLDLEFMPMDDEVKMAVHFAHDAGDPAYVAGVRQQKITRYRDSVSFKGSRWTDEDEEERGPFPADAYAFGLIGAWVDMLAVGAMRAEPGMTLESARSAALRTLDPRNLRIRNSEWSAERQRRKLRRAYARRSADEGTRRQERERLKAYRAANPDEVKAARKADALVEKAARAARGESEFVGIDSEGFDTLRYIAQDDGYPHDERGRKITNAMAMAVLGVERKPESLTEHNFDWYFNAHHCSDGAEASARNKTFPGDIFREHKSFLWGAGNDGKQEWLTRSEDGKAKVALTTPEIFDWLISLNKKFPNAIFVAFSFSYDATMALAGLDYETALTLQKGKRPTSERN